MALGKIKPVADHKQVRNAETNVVCADPFHAPGFLFQQHADLDAAGL